ncbi:universal stress protein [Candidatus Chrysopegis kryptomonas]|jgi:nucleotide-binding universal stress UspA family protein|uniref:Universal stress protein n=1 Tax=Candidatus Chryseopegocella kryptomonas TaxID=1633643 RepID=A0A0P1MX17_9BACT|nr:universal stress protein [Candidatus Chrysopegis kryptomonas]CUT00509.1 Nucleotide-binding universal stress protein, UspA family [Candidatus Chrysopegis kryptomonas]
MRIKRILLPTDLSEASISAFKYAKSLAEKYGASIYVLHILENLPPVLAIHALDLTVDRVEKNMEENARNQLERIVKENLKTKAKIQIFIRKGLVDDEIVKFADEKKIDLIVMGTHGRTGIEYTLLGSIAEKVVRKAKCPVLTVKPEKK